MASLNLFVHTRLYQHFSGAAMFSIEWASDLSTHLIDIGQSGILSLPASEWLLPVPADCREGATASVPAEHRNVVALAVLDVILKIAKHLPSATKYDVHFRNDATLMGLLAGANDGVFNNIRFLPPQQLKEGEWVEVLKESKNMQSKAVARFIKLIYSQPKLLLAGHQSINRMFLNGEPARNPKLTTVHIGTDGSYHQRYGGATAAWISNAFQYNFFQLTPLPTHSDNSTYAELYAITKALTHHKGQNVRIYTDSRNSLEYIRTGSAPNRMMPMVREIQALLQMNERLVQFQWVKSHAGHSLNEGADRIARTLRFANSGEQKGPLQSTTRATLKNIMRDTRKLWRTQYNENPPVEIEVWEERNAVLLTVPSLSLEN